MVEVIGTAFLVAMIWLVTYGMSATVSAQRGGSMHEDEASPPAKRAA
jgi:hypothetical protein